MRIVLLMIYVTKETVSMHVGSQLVGVMPDVKTEFTVPPAFAYQTISGIHELPVIHVSRR